MFGDLDLFNENEDHKKINVQLSYKYWLYYTRIKVQAFQWLSFDGRLSKSSTTRNSYFLVSFFHQKLLMIDILIYYVLENFKATINTKPLIIYNTV